MAVEIVAVLFGDGVLQTLDIFIHKLNDFAGIDTDHVIVMTAAVALKHGLGFFKVVTGNKTGLLKLREHAVDSGQTNFIAGIDQSFIDIFGGEVRVFVLLQNLQYPHPRRSDLKPCVSELLLTQHPLLLCYGCGQMMTEPSFTPAIWFIMRTFHHALVTKFNTKLKMLLNLKRLLLLSLICASLSGCVYHVDVQQGNRLDLKDIEQVQLGMTQSQVRYLLGSPVVGDPFHPERWDYMYYFLAGRAKVADQRWVIIYFEDDRVSGIVLDAIVEPS